LEIPKRERLEKLRRKLGGLIEMANKKESIPDPRAFNPVRDRFWAEKYKQTPNFDHKDWAVEKKNQEKK
jgi:hypothetical protein